MAEDNDNDCEELSGVLTIVFISGSINVWTLIFAGFSVPRMSWKSYRSSGSLAPTPLMLRRSELVFFLLCALHALCQIPDVLAHCYLHATAWGIFKTINSTTYLFHWVGAFAIFYQRLRLLFRGTPGQLHRRHDILCAFIVVTVVVMFCILVLDDNFTVLSLPHVVFIGLAATILVMLPLYVVILGMKFIQKLYWVNKQAERDPRVISAMTRYTLLALLAMCLSMFVLFGSVAIIASHSLSDPWDYIYQHSCQSLNVLVDTMCVSLSMPMHTTYYNYLCKSCHRRCKFCCSRCSDKTSDRVSRQLAAQISITSNSTPTARNMPVSPPIPSKSEASGDTPNLGINVSERTRSIQIQDESVIPNASNPNMNLQSGLHPPISPMDIEMGSIPSIKDELELEREQKEESARSDLRLDEHKMIEEEEEEEDIEDIDRGSAEVPNHDMEFPNIPPVLTVTNGSNIAIIH